MQMSTNFTLAPFSGVHRKIAAGVIMGQISDGYALRIAGVYLLYAQQPLNLSGFWMGLIGAGSLFGVFWGSLLTGMLTDKIGRKSIYSFCMLASVIIAIWQYWLLNPGLLVCARILQGMTVGSDYAVGTPFLYEWAPARWRGKITSCLVIFWMLGYCLAYAAEFFIGWMFAAFGEDAWRLILCTAAIPSFIAFVIRTGSPESPLWLVTRNREGEALELVRRHLGPTWTLPQHADHAKPAAGSWFELFAPDQRRRTVFSCSFYVLQVIPFYAISIFLPLVLAQMHMANANTAGLLYNLFTLLGSFLGFWIYNAIPRRAFLIWTFYASAILLAILTAWTSAPPILGLALTGAFALTITVAVVAQFSYPSELFPTELRASGVGLTMGLASIGSGTGTFLLPLIISTFNVHVALSLCVGCLLLGGIISQLWAPETSGRGK